MTKIKLATTADTDVLALLARITWAESHGDYIADKDNLLHYLNQNFSVSKTRQELNDPNILFYIIYVDDLPVGYAKLLVHAKHEHIASQNTGRLERIFVQKEFIPLKIGRQLLTFVERKAKALQIDTIWLTVYIKNDRAIRFYEKNEFKNLGTMNFHVNGTVYDNIAFSKKI